MNDVKKLLARIGTARDAISRKEEQTSLDFMIDGVLMNCAVMLKEQEEERLEWIGAVAKLTAENELLKEREPKMVKSVRTVAYRTLGYCPSCGRGLDSYHDGNSGEHITHFCYNCGQAVKWE